MTDDPELVPEDDAVIGRALRRSLLVLAPLAAVLALGVWMARRPAPPAAPVPLRGAAPQAPAAGGQTPAIRFVDVTRQAGIDFERVNGAYGDKLLPEAMGGGVAFVDLIGDERPDLLFVDGDRWPWRGERSGDRRGRLRLYRNDGDFRFRDVTREAGLGISMQGMGVAVGDADADGALDLFVTGVGPARLLRGGDGRFTDVTRVAGVAGAADDWTTCATFFDADNDGDLDLFVCRYVRWSRDIDFAVDYRLTGVGRAYGPPNQFEGADGILYRNEGGMRFRDVTAESGIAVPNPATGAPMGKALGAVPVDIDGDGWTDLFVGNDTVAKFLFHNQGGGRFRERGTEFGVAYDRMGNATGAMGVDAARYFDERGDDALALLAANFANEMTSLYVAQGEATLFADEAITVGLGAPSRLRVKFGAFFFDADLDGRLDVLHANGHLEEEIAKVDPSQTYRQAAQLFWNRGAASGPTFVELAGAATGDLERPVVGRGAAYADADGDGDLDVVIAQASGSPLLLRNDQATGHHWLRARLRGKSPNLDALGAVVEIETAGRRQQRLVTPSRSYLSQVELPVTFGLGGATRVDRVRVLWPGGGETSLTDVAADRLVTIEQAP